MNAINEELNLDESDDESDHEKNCANRDIRTITTCMN